MDAKYQIVLRAKDGSHISDWYEAETMKRAKELCSQLLSDDWASSGETTHDNLDTLKVEVIDQSGACVYDRFRI